MHRGDRDPKGNYVYRFLDKDRNIIYVGRTQKLRHRIFQHLHNKSNLPKEGVDKIYYIEYVEFESECDMALTEIYLINYYQPKYNIDSKSFLGEIHIPIPDKWIQFDVQEDIHPSKKQLDNESYLRYKQDIKFNKEIFTNEKLTDFIDNHKNCVLNNDELKKLSELCDIENMNLNDINNIIVYNNSKAHIIEDKNDKILKIEKKGKCGFGTFFKFNNEWIFKMHINDERKVFHGNNRYEIADQVDAYLRKIIT